MMRLRLFSRLFLVSGVAAFGLVLLVACGGGGSGSSSGGGDVIPGAKPVANAVDGPDNFLLFPNPQKQADGTLEVNSAAFAKASKSIASGPP